MLVFDAYPKVNVFLKIIGIDARGYHLLDSRFCLARGALKDTICIKTANTFSLKGNFTCSMEDNTIYKALHSLKQYLESSGRAHEVKKLENLSIEVEKNIPTGAGLGGGSSDAGALLWHLNEEFFSLSMSELYEVGARVGADVCFFLSRQESANVYGAGEVIEAFEEEALEFEIYTPPIACDTRKVYEEYDRGVRSNIGLCGVDLMYGGSLMGADSLTHGGSLTHGDYHYKQFAAESSKEILARGEREELNDLYAPALRAYPALKDHALILGKEWFFSGSGSSFFRLKEGDRVESGGC